MTFLAFSLAAYAIFVCLYAMKFLVDRPVAILFMIVAILGHHLLILEALGRAKPYAVELFDNLDGAKVIAFAVTGDEINVWLKVGDEPIAYSIEYSDKKLAELYRATEGAGPDNWAEVKEHHDILNAEKDLTFHPAPVQPMEEK